jgi:hypothetical protein
VRLQNEVTRLSTEVETLSQRLPLPSSSSPPTSAASPTPPPTSAASFAPISPSIPPPHPPPTSAGSFVPIFSPTSDPPPSSAPNPPPEKIPSNPGESLNTELIPQEIPPKRGWFGWKKKSNSQLRPKTKSTRPSASDGIKLIIIGSERTGKSRLSAMFFRPKGPVVTEYEPTVGAVFISETITVNGREVTVNFWDTAGQERYQ